MKKIAIFQTDLNIGGIQKSLINLTNSINYQQYEIDLYLLTVDNLFVNELNKNVNLKIIKDLPYFCKFIPFKILKIFYKNDIEKEYDMAIDFNSYSMKCALATLSANAGKNVVWVHNDIDKKLKDDNKYKVLYSCFKSKYKYYDYYVAVSNGALESFKKNHEYKDKKYIVIPNLIDTNEIARKSKEQSKITVDKSKINICSTGRLTHQKGFDILINNIKELSLERNDFHLYIIGDGEERKNLEKQIKNLNLTKYITITGYSKNPYSLMNEMDAFVLTSRYEGQGMVFLEAKALGLEIIMPKHLEKYVCGIKGTDDIVVSMNNIIKREKNFNYLKDYNDDIIKKIHELFEQ